MSAYRPTVQVRRWVARQEFVSAAEAAALWGCTERNIHDLAQRGVLPVAQVVQVVTKTGYRTTKLFRAMDVLQCRAKRKDRKRSSMAKNRAVGEVYRARNLALSRVWHSLPAEVKRGVGRKWMTVAAHYLHTPTPNIPL